MIYDKRVTAIVPIKGETELVDGRLRLFNNKPLFRTLLDKLENVFAIDEIIVDTDLYDLEKELLSLYGKIIFVRRPLELSKSETDINEIIKHDLAHTENKEIFIQTHINKPLLKKETLAKALKEFVELEDKYDSLFSVNTHKSRFYFHDRKPINHELNHLVRTKDLKPVYEENSCFYIFTRDSFENNNHRIGINPYLFDTSTIESLELADSLSYKLAEILLLYQQV